MSSVFELSATLRTDMGKGASRRLRRSEQVPAVLYSKTTEATPITLDHKKVLLALQKEAFYSHILTIDVNGKKEKAVLKAVQRHPYKALIMHLDFLRVSAKEKIVMHVPLHFLNEEMAPGVKEGGIFNKQHNEVEIRCLPGDLPEYIEVDCGNMALDAVIHLSEVKLPKGIELMALSHGEASHDFPIVSLHRPHAVAADEEVVVEEATVEPSAEAAGESSEESTSGGESA